MSKSIWGVRSMESRYEHFVAYFATEREARDWSYKQWGDRLKASGELPSETTTRPVPPEEIHLTTMEETR